MGVIRPRPPASQNLASDRAANLADRQQIRRLISTVPPPKKQTAGTMQGFTRATNSGFSVVGTEVRLFGWEFDGGWNANDNPAPDLSLPAGAGPTEQRFGVVDAGWYGIRCDFSCDVGGGIPSIRVDFLFGADGQGSASTMRTVAVRHNGVFQSSAWVGPIYVKSVAEFTYPFGVQVFWPSVADPSCSFAAAELDVWRLG